MNHYVVVLWLLVVVTLPKRFASHKKMNSSLLSVTLEKIHDTSPFVFTKHFTRMKWQPRHCHEFHLHTTRFGPQQVTHPAGIACRCDWVIVRDYAHKLHIFMKHDDAPNFIFVSTDSLAGFASFIHQLPSKVVLISGISDMTFPINLDVRYNTTQAFQEKRIHDFNRIVANNNVSHWFVENLSVKHGKVSPLPIGMTYDDRKKGKSPDDFYKILSSAAPTIAWEKRPINVLSIDKYRIGIGQWADRRRAALACQNSSFCVTAKEYAASRSITTLESGFSHDIFVQAVSDAKFTVMVHGGGLDPCPKLFESILLGSIPIIEESIVSAAVTLPHLPVAVVPSILEFLDEKNSDEAMVQMDRWSKELGPYYEMRGSLRETVLNHLTQDYWWDLVKSKLIQ